ncbi:hypothetical protein IWQ57_006517, partial [Coemansia nantahalensis]
MSKLTIDAAASRSFKALSLADTAATASAASEQPGALSRVVAVTHFLPFTISVAEETPAEPYQWTVAGRRGHTAMYAAIRSLNELPSGDCIQVGWIGNYTDVGGEERPCDAL